MDMYKSKQEESLNEGNLNSQIAFWRIETTLLDLKFYITIYIDTNKILVVWIRYE